MATFEFAATTNNNLRGRRRNPTPASRPDAESVAFLEIGNLTLTDAELGPPGGGSKY